MKKLRKISAAVTAILIFMVSLTGCTDTEKNTDESVSETSSQSATASVSKLNYSQNNESNISSEYFDNDDLDTSYDNPDAVISLNGSSAEINGKGAEFTDKRIRITSGGVYLFSGILDDGQIYVNTKEKVHIVLDGTDISCSDSSPIYIEDSDNAVITVNGENTLSDAVEYSYENADDNEPDAVIYSKDDLAINGTGTLNITANYNEGVTSKNDLRISGVILNIVSAGNAVKGKDSLAVMDAVITADSKADGLKSSNSEETDKGYIVIESGEFNITAAQDALQAEMDIIINGGTFNIKTGTGEKTNASNQQTSDFGGRRFMGEGNPDKTDDSEKGFKSGKSMVINGGNITADCTDDTIHSNGTVVINDGSLNLSSGDDGIHADEQIDINSGEVNINKSYEGIEATVINVNGGTVRVKASDDGFNASEGSSDSDTSDTGNNFGRNPGGGFGDVSENCILNINNGYVYVNADGDGLDSNGMINIKGGTILVDGPVNDGNGALDSGTDINISGGTLIAAGSSGMAEIPSNTSSQRSLAISFEQSCEADSIVCVKDENGKNIAVYSPSKEYSSVIISLPDIAQGKEYSVYYGGKCTGTKTDGLYSDGEYSDGTLLGTEKADEAVTQIGTGTLGTMGGGMGKFHGGNKFGEISGEMTPPDMSGDDTNRGFGGKKPDNMPEGMTPPDIPDMNMPTGNPI